MSIKEVAFWEAAFIQPIRAIWKAFKQLWLGRKNGPT